MEQFQIVPLLILIRYLGYFIFLTCNLTRILYILHDYQ